MPAHAQEPNEQAAIKVPAPDFSALKHTKSGRIDKVIDGLTILLKDKTIIRLASLDIPDFHIWRDAPYSIAALQLLEETLPEGTEVMVYQTRMAKKGRINRMNHELAHIQTKSTENIRSGEKSDPVWIQGLLLARGLARVQIAPEAPEMVAQMLNIEKQARTAQRGIWATESDYNILTPEKAADYIGEFALVEGTVEKAASVRNNVYLNFGKDWKTDFTIMITPDLRKKLAHRGVDPLGLARQRLRVRGWIREYNGPLIELDTPEHLEILPDKPLQQPGENPKVGPNP
jgi:endonuclease YncB( thermonuclease family)